MNTYPFVELSLQSLKNFQDYNLAVNVLNKINEYKKDFVPDVFGVYQPLKKKYNLSNIEECVKLWMNDECNENNAAENYVMGQLLMEKKKGSKVKYLIMWQKDNQARFNCFSMSVEINYLEDHDCYNKFIDLCKELVVLIEPVHGDILNQGFPGWEAPIDLKIRLPEINWMVFLGQPYIEMFGKDKILNTPCYRVEEVSQNIISLQTIKSVFNDIPDDVKNNIKSYLGEDAFVWEGKSIRAYKDGKVPKFDFSEVLFDKTKPIVDIQTLSRQR